MRIFADVGGIGCVAEWTKAPASKAGGLTPPVSSNLTAPYPPNLFPQPMDVGYICGGAPPRGGG